MKRRNDSPDLRDTIEPLKGTVANLNQIEVARRVLSDANREIVPLLKDLRETSDEIDKTMKEVRDTLVTLQQGLDPDAPLIVHLDHAFEPLDQTSRSVGELTDCLQRNPVAVVRGR